MLITVVIPTYNRRKLLARCLQSLFRQEWPLDDVEIVVVVDGATDDTRQYLREVHFPCDREVIEQENCGQGVARNAGIRAARGQYVLLLDDDLACEPELLAEHLSRHDGSRKAVLGPIARDPGDQSIPALAVERELQPFYSSLAAGKLGFAWLPPNTSIARDILLGIGGYDETFSRAREDTDLGLRLLERGVQFEFAPRAIAQQSCDKSANDLVNDAVLFGKHDVMLARKSPHFIAQSNLSNLDGGPGWKRMARYLATGLPFSVEPLLRVPYSVAEGMALKELAIRLLNSRRYTAWLRSASREAGGLADLKSFVASSRAGAKGA